MRGGGQPAGHRSQFEGIDWTHYSGGPRIFTPAGNRSGGFSQRKSGYERSTYWQSFPRLEDVAETTWNGSLLANCLYGYDLEGRRLATNFIGNHDARSKPLISYQSLERKGRNARRTFD